MVPIAPGKSTAVNSPLTARRNPCEFPPADVHGTIVQKYPTISPRELIPRALVKTEAGGSMEVYSPSLNRNPCRVFDGSRERRYWPTMSPLGSIPVALVKLASGK